MSEEARRKIQGARLQAARMAAGYRSAREAAIENGWTESSYRSHENGTRTIGPDDAERYVRVFRAKGSTVDAAKILFGTERDRSAADRIEERSAPSGTDEVVQFPRGRFVRPSWGGVVEAGAWREANDYDDDPDRTVPMEEVDRDYPEVPLIAFAVNGDSMNALEPRPLLPGDRVIALDWEGLKNRVPARDGMVVVVEQIREGGHLRERSVKQLKIDEEWFHFQPRSTNPRHKPFKTPYNPTYDEDAGGQEVRILGWVRRVTSDVPGW